ncbi:GntR family transcriptional regulator [Celeribacter sp.]|uniref:GntR family transcriptional regulator n=1 Tax=Celeribacter sp. TaxID=1890673 RepID=UPI003A8EDF54
MKTPTIPKYKMVHDELLKRLKAGMYSVGTRLPSEDALARSFGVSRLTARRALEPLVDAGYLVSRQGSGYLVNTLSPPETTCLTSFTDMVLRDGQIPGARLIEIREVDNEAPNEVTSLFHEPVALIRRLRTVDGVPTLLVSTWLPCRLVEGMSPEDFPQEGQDQSILRILSERFNLDWGRACETIGPCAAPEDAAEHLGIEKNTPILSQACTAFDSDHNPVFFDQVYRVGPVTFNLVGAQRSSDTI